MKSLNYKLRERGHCNAKQKKEIMHSSANIKRFSEILFTTNVEFIALVYFFLPLDYLRLFVKSSEYLTFTQVVKLVKRFRTNSPGSNTSFHMSTTAKYRLSLISFIITAQDDCSQDSVTFERITGINSPLSQFVMDELLLTQNETHSITWQNDCYRLCKTKPKCSGFFVDYIENSCRLLSDWTPTATTEHTTTLQNTGSYFEKICIRGQSEFTTATF